MTRVTRVGAWVLVAVLVIVLVGTLLVDGAD